MGRRKKHVSFEVPSLLVQIRRWMFCVLISIVWDAFTTVIILGEDVFWRLNFIDTLVSNAGTTTGDIFIAVWSIGQFLILSVFILWNIGVFGYMRDWADANL